jgi:PII-like signaling protein
LALALVLARRLNEALRPRSRLHTAKILRLSEDLPMVIEIVDAKEKIDELAPAH